MYKRQIISSASNQIIFDKFKAIPWYEDALEAFYSLSGASRDKEERFVKNHFSFFQLKNTDTQGEKALVIIPDSISDIDVQERNFGFSIDYVRPKLVPSNSLLRFFGAPSEKIDNKYVSHKLLVPLENVIEIIEHFINDENDALEKVISNQGASLQ